MNQTRPLSMPYLRKLIHIRCGDLCKAPGIGAAGLPEVVAG